MFTNAENVHTGGFTKGRFSEYQHYLTWYPAQPGDEAIYNITVHGK